VLNRDANFTHWQYKEGNRRDWILEENWLRRCVGGRIWDVGCDKNKCTVFREVFIIQAAHKDIGLTMACVNYCVTWN